MDKIQFDRVLKPLIEIYDEIELDIIRNILERLKNYTKVEGSLEWYLEKLVDLGTFRSDNLKIFKKNHKKIEKELKKIVNASARHQDYMEVLENYYEKGLLKVNPSDLYNGTAFNRIIDNALKDTNDITDLIQTKALEGANESYKNILNKAYIETSGGVYSYQESIRRSLKEFAKEGIKTVHYASGKTLGIESVVRRDVVTRVNKLVGDIDLENARELGTNLVYVDQHLGARVRTPYMKNDYEAHAEWQGKVYMIDGSNDKYDNFFEKTGYGEMLGLKGINCYHGFRAFFEWEDIPKEVDKEENKKKYELFQKQRAYERKIRRLKREREVYKEFDKDKYKEVNTSLQSTYKELDKFVDDNNLRRDYLRENIVSHKKTLQPNFIGEKKDGIYTAKEIKTMTNQLNDMLNKYVEKKSSWSGNVIIRDKGPSGMLWNGDIITKNATSSHEILHELIHLKSLNLDDNGVYINEVGLEEIPVQLLTQEISLKEGIQIIPSKYDNMVNKLKEVNKIAKISPNDYLFAKEIINKPISQRYDWLIKQIKNDKAINLINEIRDDELWKKRH